MTSSRVEGVRRAAVWSMVEWKSCEWSGWKWKACVCGRPVVMVVWTRVVGGQRVVAVGQCSG